MRRPLSPDRRLQAVALAVGVATIALRLPFVARRMWDHDSIQFALGVERYDLAAHHPHPPGYPIYIALLKLLRLAGVEPLAGMVGLTVLAAGIGGGLVVLLAARLLDRDAPERQRLAAGLFAGVLYATNPLLWFYGELPLLYAVEGGATVAVALAVARLRESAAAFYVAVALLAIVGGLRQSTLVLLLPLFLFELVRAWRAGMLPARRIAAGAALGAALCAAWFVPLAVAAGGLAEYRRIGSEHFRTLLPATSVLQGAGWGALRHNLEVLTKWALQGVLPGGAALAVLAVAAPRRLFSGWRSLRRALPLLGAWALPPIAFFALFHITKAGYTLIHLPAFLVALAICAAPLLAGDEEQRSRLGDVLRVAAAFGVAVAVGAGLFLFGHDRRLDEPRWHAIWAHEFRAGTIRDFEAELDRTLDTIRHEPPGSTVLVTVELSGTGAAGADGFLYPYQRHLQWYLPEYLVVHAVPEDDLAFVARGHEPFHEVLSQLFVPARTHRLIYVLSAWPGERLRLGPGVVAGSGKFFTLAVVPFAGTARIGPLEVTAERLRKAS